MMTIIIFNFDHFLAHIFEIFKNKYFFLFLFFCFQNCWPIFGQHFLNFQYFLFFIILFKMKQNGQQMLKMCFWPIFGPFLAQIFKILKFIFLFYCSKWKIMDKKKVFFGPYLANWFCSKWKKWKKMSKFMFLVFFTKFKPK